MRIGERGSVSGRKPRSSSAWVHGSIVLKKAPKKLALRKWKGRAKDSFAELGYPSVDKFIDDVRGR